MVKPSEYAGMPAELALRVEALTRPEYARGLLKAASNTALSALYHDAGHTLLWSFNVPDVWADVLAGSRSEPQILEARARLAEARDRALATGAQQTLTLQAPFGRVLRWFDIWIDIDRDTSGAVVGLITTIVETTDHKRREQTLRALLREVSHRSKNLLAIILSIASQTGRYSGSTEIFLTRLRGRIQSLAASQDLVTSSDWRGAELQQLARQQIARYRTDPARSLTVSGDNPYLNPNAALHVGLALHELIVNSISYGALAREDGNVSLLARPAGQNRMGIVMLWEESLPGHALSERQKRFGSIALERIVPAALDGSATLDLGGDHVRYELFVPEFNYELATDTRTDKTADGSGGRPDATQPPSST